jgi:hypothetical protein
VREKPRKRHSLHPLIVPLKIKGKDPEREKQMQNMERKEKEMRSAARIHTLEGQKREEGRMSL